MLPFGSFLLSLSHGFLHWHFFITIFDNRNNFYFLLSKKKGPVTILLSFYFLKIGKNMACREENTYILKFSGSKVSSTSSGQKGTFFDKSQFEKTKNSIEIFKIWKYFARKSFLLFLLFLLLPTFFPTKHLFFRFLWNM